MHDYELTGHSLFETVLAAHGRFRNLDYHWRRIKRSAARFGLECPSWQSFLTILEERHDRTRCEVLRVTLIRTGGRWTEQEPGTELRTLVRIATANTTPRSLAISKTRLPDNDPIRRHKSGSRLAYQLALAEATAQHCDDALIVDRRGRLLETTTANIFLLIDQGWVTPPLALGLLPGGHRAWILSRSQAKLHPTTLKQLAGVRAAIVTNSVTGPVAVSQIDSMILDLAPSRQFIKNLGSMPSYEIKHYRQIVPEPRCQKPLKQTKEHLGKTDR